MEKYQHYKGPIYIKLFEAIDASADREHMTDEEKTVVVYTDESGANHYTRLKSNWIETTEVAGVQVPRFKKLS